LSSRTVRERRTVTLPSTLYWYLSRLRAGTGWARSLMRLETSRAVNGGRRPNPKPRRKRRGFEVLHDTQTGMPLGMPRGARCVQRFDDSLNSAIHITFRAFAAFFIDAKAKRSVVESCVFIYDNFNRMRTTGVGVYDKTDEGLPSRARVHRCEWMDIYEYIFGNDPSAGSPTETLLRLLLPLNDQV
jgi:hypothetical protein